MITFHFYLVLVSRAILILVSEFALMTIYVLALLTKTTLQAIKCSGNDNRHTLHFEQ